jgi:hypothetical protein
MAIERLKDDEAFAPSSLGKIPTETEAYVVKTLSAFA